MQAKTHKRNHKNKNGRFRRIRAIWRDTLLLVREFIRPLSYFALAIIGGGLIYYQLAHFFGEAVGSRSLAEAFYQVLGLTFLQPLGDNLPEHLPLQLFYFIMPIIGISILAQGLTDFGILFFNRRERSKEWEMAVASTFQDHIVLVGLGHLGYRVAQKLYELDRDVAVIELNPDEDLIAETQGMGIPVLKDDARREVALQGAGVAKARSIILCTQNDSMNLQIAFKARRLNPQIRVVVRIFDDDFGQSLQEQFGFRAMSATGMAAPTFAAAAADVDVTRPITVEGEALSLARLKLEKGSRLVGLTVSEVEQNFEVSVVLLREDGRSDFHPAGERKLQLDHVLGVLGGPDPINRLVDANYDR
ncbi:MAG: NAD-binding protein [Ardenticatenaceae bacterium]|nr:NAD-binding protein [Anaerolineales bacterium]MCB8940325.1 NAD-binding protein [Ardenticatenaceae bacterium]MCB8973341.1 NAD-binding protein [Ardenticatenaceae bacterium]